jgi:hypothetical protein
MINYALKEEELFYLCTLSGATALLGIGDPSEGLNTEEAEDMWKKVLEQLVSNNILSSAENGEVFIDRDYLMLASVLSFPDQVFVSLTEHNEAIAAEFIHSKSGIYTHLKGEGVCEIQLYQDREDCLTLLCNQFLLTDCANEVQFKLPTSLATHALTLADAGDVKDSALLLQEYGIDPEIALDLANAFYKNLDSRIVAGYYLDPEGPSEMLFSVAKTEQGTWVIRMKPDGDQVILFRLHPDNALKYIIDFYWI